MCYVSGTIFERNERWNGKSSDDSRASRMVDKASSIHPGVIKVRPRREEGPFEVKSSNICWEEQHQTLHGDEIEGTKLGTSC